MSDELDAVDDQRAPDLTDYSAATLLWTGILMLVCRLGARRQIAYLLNTPQARAYLGALSGQKDLRGVPHGDTLKGLLLCLSPVQLRQTTTGLVRSMIRHRRLEAGRLLDRYYTIALDGTGWLALGHRQSRFTQGCLSRKLTNGDTLYYRPVLEAKLLTRCGLALSVETEFPENQPRPGQSEDDYKQDCELAGAKRLLPRLKEAFPQLAICVLGDALLANGPMFDLCGGLGWSFIFTLKEGSLPSVCQEFYALAPLAPENHKRRYRKDDVLDIRWINDIPCQEHKLHVLECVQTDKGTGKKTRWLWISNIPITAENCVELVLHGGRLRWKIENEGYNVQKNGGYEMEHAYAQDAQAAKNFYLLLQIAHMLAQLFERRMGGKAKVTRQIGSLKNLAARLLESLRTQAPPQQAAWAAFMATRIQVRLDSS